MFANTLIWKYASKEDEATSREMHPTMAESPEITTTLGRVWQNTKIGTAPRAEPLF